MVLTYFLNDFEMAPVAPIVTGILSSSSSLLLLLLLTATEFSLGGSSSYTSPDKTNNKYT
jgi:hypothetical protein